MKTINFMSSLFLIGAFMMIAGSYQDNSEVLYVGNAKYEMVEDGVFHKYEQDGEIIIDTYNGTHTLIFEVDNAYDANVLDLDSYVRDMSYDKDIRILAQDQGISSFMIYIQDREGKVLNSRHFTL